MECIGRVFALPQADHGGGGGVNVGVDVIIVGSTMFKLYVKVFLCDVRGTDR